VTGYGTRALRVYLLDDHDIVRRGLRDLLSAAHDIQVVGDGGSAQQAGRAIPALRPDVMVLDLQLQDGTGIDVCRRVRATDATIRGLLLTSAGDDEAMLATLLADAAGYLVKLEASSHVTGAIRRVGSGGSLIDPAVRTRVVDRLRGSLTRDGASFLVPGERVVLDAILDGSTDASIADTLGLSRDEVSHHVSSLIHKLVGIDPSGDGAAGTDDGGRHRR
jgi:DNA-binding NarL/FixJ family response regulator